MNRVFLGLITLLVLTSCLKEEFPVLEGNVFEVDRLGLFVLESVTRDTINETRANITVNFTSIWQDATSEQRATITGLQILGPRSGDEVVVSPETTSHLMEFVRYDWINCLELTFLTNEEVNTRTSEICVRP